MKKIFLMSVLGLVLCMTACKPNRDETLAKIHLYEDSVLMLDIVADPLMADTMIDMYSNFAMRFPKDSLAPLYLFRAAEVAANVGKTDNALDFLDQLIEKYPNYEDLGGAYFLIGYTYENAGKFDLAKEAYGTFVEQYPEHPLAADTKKMIPQLGLSPEEVLAKLIENTSVANLTAED